jgi:hypothetical protein
MRSTKKRGDSTPFPLIFTCLALTIFGPFIYVEVLTKIVGKDMEAAVKKAYNDGPINGQFQYFRVLSAFGGKARALAIGEERASWGGTDRPIMSINLEKKGDKWKAVHYDLLYSDRLNRDSLVLPPYR